MGGINSDVLSDIVMIKQCTQGVIDEALSFTQST